MRKTLAILAALAFSVTAAACGSDEPAAAPTAPGYTESVAPSESVPTAVVDYRQDVSDVTAKAAPESAYPEGNAAELSFVITNHGAEPATYEIVFAVYDSTKAQVGAILVNTDASSYGPTQPGATLKAQGVWLMDGGKLPEPFAVDVQSVDRIIEEG